MLALLFLAVTASSAPVVGQTEMLPIIKATKGDTFRELIGRTGSGSAQTAQASVALFHLDAGSASPWSHNKVGEESFFVLAGHGTVWTGSRSQDVGPGSF